MPRYSTSIPTPRQPDDAFGYMAAFENVADWDPGVTRAERLDSGDLKVGSRFLVVVSSVGRKLPFEYQIVEHEPPHRVVLEAETASLRSVDEIVVNPAPMGATVIYNANLELLGGLRFFNPVLGLGFKRVAARAAFGLRRELRA